MSINALSHVVMVGMQGFINATMGTCLMVMGVHHCVMLNQDFNAWEVQLIPKILV
jgi:hypothetical protein